MSLFGYSQQYCDNCLACLTPFMLHALSSYTQRATSATATCPAGTLIQLNLAEFGEAVSFSDVTTTVAGMCDSTSCNLDITKLGTYTGKVLRVEWDCQCGAGFKPGTTQNGTCTPCPPGTFRNGAMVDCSPCDTGRFQPSFGQVGACVCLPLPVKLNFELYL